MNRFKKFSIYYLTFLLLLSLLIISFNWLVNPYDIYKSLPIQKFSQKPQVTSHLRLTKAIAIKWKKPEYLILGSSTAETGLNPDFSAWDNSYVYNLGLSGANIYEVMRYLQHAEAIKPVKKVILVVNFFMFNAYVNNRDDFNESLLHVDFNGNKNPHTINTIVSTLLSFDALKASWETIKNQHKGNAFLSNGQLIHNYREEQIQQLKGYKNNFLYTESYSKASLLPSPDNQFSFANPEKGIDTIAYLQKIITICENNHTELILILAPEHVRLLETYKLLDLWGTYEQWQKKLVAIITTHNQKYPNSKFALWGFNNINSITTEQLPDKDDIATKMHWFWDPQHFKNELGNLILSMVLRLKDESGVSHFSTLLTEDNIQTKLENDRLELSKWENRHSKDIIELKQNLFGATTSKSDK
ncbi:TPA: hypothetical protein I8Z35_001029 [Legionella pneumophila]|uniref:Uncharacterized protein n=1 Tax=Legionella pneumophila TaxID=446 RepID=E7BBD7_LEGPN|nr:hypothetical protein [Legionella pneumophila]MDW8891989.1 hypothetical protein [Legionella pneumophila]CBY83848.1 hypothetical protein LPSG10_014 [Legionella pneumophila subsp. pneumophila ATCC 43283]STX78937.1 Uncharacterised protein [Legionella pneumophila]HAT1876289.1 hypothetical protein [Legionella pneumophila]HAT1880433.1 hypothetical protein [Legionella pneumophila]